MFNDDHTENVRGRLQSATTLTKSLALSFVTATGNKIYSNIIRNYTTNMEYINQADHHDQRQTKQAVGPSPRQLKISQQCDTITTYHKLVVEVF